MSLRYFASRSAAMASQASRVASRRLASTAAPKPKTAQDIMRQNADFKRQWLSDPSTYPIMIIMAGGLSWMVGMSINGLFYKGVDINPNVRGRVMKDYSSEHKVGVIEAAVGHRVKPEGLGIDHEKWQKQKEEYFEK